MRRRAHIEFLSSESVKITTAFKQKVIVLKDDRNTYIDLVNLTLSRTKTDFYARISSGEGTIESPFSLSVYAKTSSDGQINFIKGVEDQVSYVCIGDCDCQTFRVNLVE